VNEQNAYGAVVLQHFFECFRTVTYHKVQICTHLYYEYLIHCAKFTRYQNILPTQPRLREEMARIADADLPGWADEPYVFDAYPRGTILMRGGFGDIAAAFLPPERYYLLSPGQAEVDVIKQNRPVLAAQNIEELYRPNPGAIAQLSAEFTRIAEAHKDDPLLGGAAFLNWILPWLPMVVSLFDAIQRLIEEKNIGGVLSISTIEPFDGALNLLARANRIPSISLQHGIITEEMFFCHAPVLAAKKAVWGPATRDWYGRYGVPPTRVCVTGSPRFDAIFNQPWGGKEKLRRILQLSPDSRLAVYTTQPLCLEDAEKVTATILEGIKDIGNLFLLILLHPAETGRLDFYRGLASAYQDCRVVRFGHISLYDALSGADILFACYSTSVMEAMLFQVPVVTVEPFPPVYSYGDLGACPKVRDADELHRVAGRILGEEDCRRQTVAQSRSFLEQHCLPDGSSSARLMREVEDLCNMGGVL